MSNTMLPKNIAAKWMWKKSLLGKEDSFVFARKTFTLSQSGMVADFWISANHSYQLFVNGRFIGHGPSPAPSGISYADYYDLSYYLVTGINVIAVLAHHSNYETYANSVKAAGLWCQLDIDGSPVVSSGTDWKMFGDSCYQLSRPRRGKHLEFVEICDLQQYPRGWRAENYYDLGWEYCDYTVKAEEFDSRLEVTPLESPEFEELNDGWNIVVQGTHNPAAMLTQVHFSEVASRSGVYAAVSNFLSDEERDQTVWVFCDEPCRIFVNGVLACIHDTSSDLGYSDFSVRLKDGWNEIMVIQQVTPSGMGALFAFAGMNKGSLKFLVDEDIAADDGWKIYGPLRKPFQEITSSLDRSAPCLGQSRSEKALINDGHAYLESSEVKPFKTDFGDQREVELQRYEYVVFDLGLLQYGFPGLYLDGKAGDVVDITFGETLSEFDIPRNNDSTRATDTLILRPGENSWMKFDPTCCRYLMVSTRRCNDSVNIKGLWIAHYARNFRKRSYFKCGDDEIIRIWEISRYLSLLSSKNCFIGSPFHRRTQYLSDACILSRNAYYLSSDYSLTRKAITEYAAAQYEDGSIPRSVSGLPEANHIDQMMLFPLWVQEYFKYSGDRAFMERMLPHIDRLEDFLTGVADPATGLLDEFLPWQNIRFLEEEKGIDKQGMVTALNALYCRALFSAAELYQHAENLPKAEKLRMKAAKIAGRVRKLTYDPEQHCFADCYHNGAKSSNHSIYTNIMALYSGIAQPEDADAIFFRFFDRPNWTAELSLDKISILFRFWLLDTLFAYGQSGLALEYMRFCNRELSSDKALTPGLALDRTLPTNSYLIQEIVGIRMATPGFSTVYFNPAVDLVKSVRMALPTAHGRIKVDWKIDDHGNLEAKIDANYPLQVVPQLPNELEGKTTLMLGKQVVVLDPDSNH